MRPSTRPNFVVPEFWRILIQRSLTQVLFAQCDDIVDATTLNSSATAILRKWDCLGCPSLVIDGPKMPNSVLHQTLRMQAKRRRSSPAWEQDGAELEFEPEDRFHENDAALPLVRRVKLPSLR